MSNAAAIAAMKRLTGTLRKLSEVPSQAARAASEKISKLIEDQFDAGTDPYGQTWARLADGRPSHLTETGAMRQFDVSPMSGAGVSIVAGASYAAYHQSGTRYMPQRKLLPDAGLPESWAEALHEAVQEASERAKK